jgi:hypothetical protein
MVVTNAEKKVLKDIYEYYDDGVEVHKDSIMAHIVGKDDYEEELSNKEDKKARAMLDNLTKKGLIYQDSYDGGYVNLSTKGFKIIGKKERKELE